VKVKLKYFFNHKNPASFAWQPIFQADREGVFLSIDQKSNNGKDLSLFCFDDLKIIQKYFKKSGCPGLHFWNRWITIDVVVRERQTRIKKVFSPNTFYRMCSWFARARSILGHRSSVNCHRVAVCVLTRHKGTN